MSLTSFISALLGIQPTPALQLGGIASRAAHLECEPIDPDIDDLEQLYDDGTLLPGEAPVGMLSSSRNAVNLRERGKVAVRPMTPRLVGARCMICLEHLDEFDEAVALVPLVG